MTKRLYSIEPQGHGGTRRNALAPALTQSEVLGARELYEAGVPYKTLIAAFGVSRFTLSRAIHSRRSYEGLTPKPPVPRGVRNRNKA